jgi:TRL-like protein family
MCYNPVIPNISHKEAGMKIVKLFSAVLVVAFLVTGCLYTHVVTPYDTNLDKTVLGQKTGKAAMYSVLGLFAWGDASSAAAAKQGGISTLNHMDKEFLNIIFGIYTETTTIVYGD